MGIFALSQHLVVGQGTALSVSIVSIMAARVKPGGEDVAAWSHSQLNTFKRFTAGHSLDLMVMLETLQRIHITADVGYKCFSCFFFFFKFSQCHAKPCFS